MKITKKKLIELDACEDGLARFVKQTGNTEGSVDVSSLVGGLNTYSDLLWLAGETLPKERIVRFSCDCALINIELIRPYTDKYDEIVQFLKEPADAVARAAVDAAGAASSVARAAAAYAAAYAADAAAAAAYAAAYAAYAAAYADVAYAADTAADAARAVCAAPDAVNSLLIEMFNEAE